jgi:hypothetical protein
MSHRQADIAAHHALSRVPVCSRTPRALFPATQLTLSIEQQSRSAGRPKRKRNRLASYLLAAIAALFLFLSAAPEASAQYDDSNPSVYWRLERQRQLKFKREQMRQRRVIQRPTRLIRRARPRRGYTRAVPAATRHRNPEAVVNPTAPATVNAQPDAAKSAPTQPDAAKPDAAATANATPGAAKFDAQPGASAKPAEKAAVPQAPAIRIAVIGDNIGSQLARGLEQTYEETPQVEIVKLTKDNSGLVRNDYYDWPAKIEELLASDAKFDVAIMMVGSNDRQPIRDASGAHPPGTPDWEKAYAARIASIASQFQKKKIPLIWLGMPIMRNERLATDLVRFNQMYREGVQKHGGTYIDVWEAFVDDRNRFTLYGPDVNGETVRLRLSDGVHFTKAGSRKAAHFASVDIKRIIDRRKQPGSPAGLAIAPAQNLGTGGTKARAPDGAGTLRAALPQPAAPAQVIIPVKPAAGPVVRLTAEPVATDGKLISAPAVRAGSGSAAVRSLVQGQPVATQRGRADDFAWPKK